MESHLKACIGYPKRTRGSFFCSLKENNVFISINRTLLEKDYMKNYKSQSKGIIEEITSKMSTLRAPSGEAPVVDENSS